MTPAFKKLITNLRHQLINPNIYPVIYKIAILLAKKTTNQTLEKKKKPKTTTVQ